MNQLVGSNSKCKQFFFLLLLLLEWEKIRRYNDNINKKDKKSVCEIKMCGNRISLGFRLYTYYYERLTHFSSRFNYHFLLNSTHIHKHKHGILYIFFLLKIFIVNLNIVTHILKEKNRFPSCLLFLIFSYFNIFLFSTIYLARFHYRFPIITLNTSI